MNSYIKGILTGLWPKFPTENNLTLGSTVEHSI
jgi:hypothetical protein